MDHSLLPQSTPLDVGGSVEFTMDFSATAPPQEATPSSASLSGEQPDAPLPPSTPLTYDKALNVTVEERQPIKVVGIGGCGGNSAQQMYKDQLRGVSYLVINTDQQQLQNNEIPDKLLIAADENKGRGYGAGNTPAIARMAAERYREQIKKHLDDGKTEIVFITAGMGGGTGTGAAPVVADIAKNELGLLTVAFVMIPFASEGIPKIIKALKTAEELRKMVDSMIVLNNERLYEVYASQAHGNHAITVREALRFADRQISVAARSITDIIINIGYINADLKDIEKTLKDGGMAIISTGIASGEERITKAIDNALNSPILNNNNDLTNAQRVLIVLHSPTSPEKGAASMVEWKQLREFGTVVGKAETITGLYEEEDLENCIKVTILASGFDAKITHESVTGAFSKRELEQKQKNEQKLIKEYYSNTVSLSGNNKLVSSSVVTPFILNVDELDDDDFIAALAATPAIFRNFSDLEALRDRKHPERLSRMAQQAPHLLQGENAATPAQEEPEVSNIITF